MGVRHGVKGTTTAIAPPCPSLALCVSLALFVSLVLWLAGCASPVGGAPAGSRSAPPASPGFVQATQEPVAGPVPAPRPAPPAAIDQRSATPLPAVPSPAGSPSGSPSWPAVYFVAIGDSGSRGVRFGCDDSLVTVRIPATAGEDPLAKAMETLLAPGDTASREGLYSALSGSALRYVSGYLDGSTAVVNLTGSLRPGGVCDHPRIEAQLTQTAVTATGASQAEIYIDGTPLTDALSLR